MSAGSNAEKVEADPDGLLREVVRMAAVSPQAFIQESLFIITGKFFPGIDQYMLGALKIPLLDVGQRFKDDEKEHQGGSSIIKNTQRHSVVLKGNDSGQSKQQDQRILVCGNKKQVEKGPFPPWIEFRFLSQYQPAVILFTGPEPPLVGPFQREIHGEAHAPEGYQHAHDDEPWRVVAVTGNNPGIDNGEEAP